MRGSLFTVIIGLPNSFVNHKNIFKARLALRRAFLCLTVRHIIGQSLIIWQLIEWPCVIKIVRDFPLSFPQPLYDLPSPAEQEVQHRPGKKAGT